MRRQPVVAAALLAIALSAVVAVAATGTARLSFGRADVTAADVRSYERLTVEGCSSLAPVGAPDLPARVLHFVIPGDSRVEDVVAEYEETELRGAHLVLPAQPEVPIGETPRWAEPDPSVYESAEPYPESRVVYL
ncbi:MAG: hypothetical protein GF400_04765, partial [Candidatus Eisenbacteria bacterium]|nr:hypothetical protein [Candidatus Eisenbacteria bacterium]